MARICYATLRDAAPYGQPSPRPGKKLERETFALVSPVGIKEPGIFGV